MLELGDLEQSSKKLQDLYNNIANTVAVWKHDQMKDGFVPYVDNINKLKLQKICRVTFIVASALLSSSNV